MDLLGPDYIKYKTVLNDYARYMHLHGFDGVETPMLEHRSLYLDTVGATSDIVSKELFEVKSMRAELSDTVLRPEGTVSVIRALLNAGQVDAAARLYYAGPMFRYARPQKGRFRQFTQLGCEVVNLSGPEYDAEIIYRAYQWISKYTDFELRINTLANPGSLIQYSRVLSQFFERNREKLRPENANRLPTNPLRLLDQLDEAEKNALENVPDIYDYITAQEREYIDTVLDRLSKLQVDFIRDPHLVRGLDYYRHTVFEFIKDGQAIGGGGRYVFDRGRFGDKASEIHGVGYGLGLERIWPYIPASQIIPIHIIQVTNFEYAMQIGSILTDRGERYNFVYDDFDKCFKLAAKLNAKSIISFDEEHISAGTVNYKTRSGHRRIKVTELVLLDEKC
jgi:histidyl-tRNA synthetase